MSFFERKIHTSLKKHLKEKQITVLTGMRRCGKTTLLKRLLDEVDTVNKLYIDFQRIDNRELFAEKNYDNIVKILAGRGLDLSKKIYIGLDEMQLVAGSASALKYLYDNYDIKFIVTGSSSFYLKNLFTESLAGRKKVFELYPLDFGEFLIFKGVNAFTDNLSFFNKNFNDDEYERLKIYYEEYIQFGGFPEVVLADAFEQKKDLLMDIVSSYINIDIRTLADLRGDRNIFNLAKMLAGRTGTRIDYSKLSRLCGIARPTVQSYIDLFEKTYLIKRISVFARHADREIVKAQKIYFCDTGLANALATLDGGAQFENTVFNQLHQKGKIMYFSLKTGREIDFIVDDKFTLEVKESPSETDAKKLKNLSKIADIPNSGLIGRYSVPNFKAFIWGGSIR